MTPERVDDIYADLETLVVELHPDPASLGPLYLQDLISKTRGYLNRVSLLLQEVSREGLALTRKLDAYETAYQASFDELLAEDEEVKSLPSIEDRKAKINRILQEDRKHINAVKKSLKEVGFIEKAVKHRYKDLESTVSSIRMQKSLIEVDQRTGSFYGDENDVSRGKASMGDPFGDDSQIMQYLEDAIKEKESENEPEGKKLQESALDENGSPVLSSEEDQIEKFLNSDDDDEFNALLKAI